MSNENMENGNSNSKVFDLFDCECIHNSNQEKEHIIDFSNNMSIAKTNDNSIKKSKDLKNELVEINNPNIKKIKTKYIHIPNSDRQNKNLYEYMFECNDNNLKNHLFTKDFLFRDEFNELQYKIETSILYKSPNSKFFKEYHLLLENSNLIILKYKEIYNTKNKKLYFKNQINKIFNSNDSNEIFTKITNFSILNNSLNQKKSILDINKVKVKNEKKQIFQYNDIYDIFHPILNLNFNLITASLSINIKKYEISIHILTLKELTFTLKLPIRNSQLLKKLYIMIQNSILNSHGYYMNLFGISLNKNFFQNYYISYKNFEYKAKTGDILLFKGYMCPSKLQRTYTKSEYDHVGILHKNNGFLYIYDATSRDGCKERIFSEYFDYMWYLLYEKIVYRELIINENDQKIKQKILNDLDEKIEIFMNKTLGKKYQMKLFPLLCGSSIRKYQKDNKWNLKEGYICSSLIMGAYLQMGICEYLKNINSSFPGDFSIDGDLPFKKPFELGPEYIIDFSY